MSDQPRPRVGFFGKIPSRGDFVRAGLSRDLVSAWDAWLQSVLPSSPVPGSDPDTSPGHPPVRVWRLVVAAGLCGPLSVAGLLLPSRDRVGRRFPLLLAVEGGLPDRGWLDRLEPIGHHAVAGLLEPDGLSSQLAALEWTAAMPIDTGCSCRWWHDDPAGPDGFRGEALPDPAAFAALGLTG